MKHEGSPLFLAVLTDRGPLWERVLQGRVRWRDPAALAAFILPSCALYGAVLAGWRSPLLSLYVAVKLPLLFLGTTAVVALFNWMSASVLGAGLSFRAVLLAVFAAMTVAAWILLGLAPVAVYFLLSGVPREGTPAQLRYAHNAMLVCHTAILALSGLAGNAALWGGLRRAVRPGCRVRLVCGAWVIAFTFVGCQLSWVLRPFVGSPFYPVAFIRPDALERNFYEFMVGEVLPFLAGVR